MKRIICFFLIVCPAAELFVACTPAEVMIGEEIAHEAAVAEEAIENDLKQQH